MSELYREENREILTLQNVKPSIGSLMWLRENNFDEQADRLLLDAKQAIERLQNYKRVLLPTDQVLYYSKIIAQTGSTYLNDLLEACLYYPFPDREPDVLEDRRTWITYQKEYRRNKAVMLREEAKQFRSNGDMASADMKMSMAKVFFDNYAGMVNGPQVLELNPDELHELIDDTYKQAEPVKLFFSDNTVAAADSLTDYMVSALDGEFEIKGIDAGLLRVYQMVLARPGYFQQAYDEHQRLVAYCAYRHGTSIEEIERYLQFKTDAMFPGQEDIEE